MTKTAKVYPLTAVGIGAIFLAVRASRSFAVPEVWLPLVLFVLATVAVGGAVFHLYQLVYSESSTLTGPALGFLAGFAAGLIADLHQVGHTDIGDASTFFTGVACLGFLASGGLLVLGYIVCGEGEIVKSAGWQEP
jgi:hypothetical protein